MADIYEDKELAGKLAAVGRWPPFCAPSGASETYHILTFFRGKIWYLFRGFSLPW